MLKTDANYSNLHPWWWRGSSSITTGTRSSGAFNADPFVAFHLFRSASPLSEFSEPRQRRSLDWMITYSSFIIYIYQSGIMTRKEKQCYESVIPVVNLFWVPATWFVSALNEAVSAGTLKNEYGAKLIMEVWYIKEFLDCSLKHFTSNYPLER